MNVANTLIVVNHSSSHFSISVETSKHGLNYIVDDAYEISDHLLHSAAEQHAQSRIQDISMHDKLNVYRLSSNCTKEYNL